MDKNIPQTLSLNLQFSFNDVRRAAALCGMSDLSDDNINKMFFNQEKRLDADMVKIMDGDGEAFNVCIGMVGVMIGLTAIENNDEAFIDEVIKNNVLTNKKS